MLMFSADGNVVTLQMGCLQEHRAAPGMLPRQGGTHDSARACSMYVYHHCVFAWAVPGNTKGTVELSYTCYS